MANPIQNLCTVVLAAWLAAYLFGKFDTNGEIRAAVHKCIVSLFTRWTK